MFKKKCFVFRNGKNIFLCIKVSICQNDPRLKFDSEVYFLSLKRKKRREEETFFNGFDPNS